MFSTTKVLLSGFFLYVLYFSCECGKVKDWTYSLDMITTTTSDPGKVSFDFKAKRIERGIYGLNGTMTLGQNFDDTVFVKIEAFRSPTGSGNYRRIAYKIPKCTFYDFLNQYYKKFMMKDLKECSNCIQFDYTWNKPVPADVYYFKECRINQDELPDHMQEGVYKIVFSFEGYVDATAELIVNVESNLGSY